MKQRLAVLLLLFLAAYMVPSLRGGGTASAMTVDEQLADPALEQRARELGRELRCLVCQNQSIDDSDADLAKDLRRVVRERLTAGDDDEQVMQYLRARYGDFVLLRPPVDGGTLVLWFGPVVLLLVGVLSVFFWRRNSQAAAEPAWTSADQRTLDDVLARDAPPPVDPLPRRSSP